LAACQAELLPVPYFHVVFTVPAAAAEIAFHNKAVVYAILFRAAAEALHSVAADPRYLGAESGAIAVLHSWGQTLQHHPHLHCIVPAGGIAPDQSRWIACRPGFFLPGHLLSRRFRDVFLQQLRAAFSKGELRFPGTLAALGDAAAFALQLNALAGLDWVVYAKPPFAGPEQVLGDLGRYTHRPQSSGRSRRWPGQLYLEGLSPGRQDQGHDAPRGRVHPPLPAAYRARRLPPHPPYRLPRQSSSHQEAGAVPRSALRTTTRRTTATPVAGSLP
jgi:hypothetical protein